MKKCKYCQTEIDKKAKVCPNCKKKQSHLVRWIILGVLAVIIIGAIVGGGDNKEDFQKEYKQNDVVTYKDVKYSITKVEKTKGSYNALSFQMVNGDGVEASVYDVTAENDIQLNFGELDAGGQIEGVIIWEQKQNDTGLKVRYYDNVLFDDDYTFQWTLD